jgi:putative NADH-flavin reductase
MKLVVFGATGRTGQILVRSALAAGQDVTAAARSPERVSASGERLRTLRCDLFDATSVAAAMSGQECVLVAVAPQHPLRPTTIFSTGIKHILEAARREGIKRVIVLGSCGVDGGTRCPPHVRLLAGLIVQPLLFHLYVDTARMEGILEMSDCDWTVVRPPRLTNGPETSRYRLGVGEHLPNVSSISRADVAAAMLRLISDGSSYRRWVEVASAAPSKTA